LIKDYGQVKGEELFAAYILVELNRFAVVFWLYADFPKAKEAVNSGIALRQ